MCCTEYSADLFAVSEHSFPVDSNGVRSFDTKTINKALFYSTIYNSEQPDNGLAPTHLFL